MGSSARTAVMRGGTAGAAVAPSLVNTPKPLSDGSHTSLTETKINGS